MSMERFTSKVEEAIYNWSIERSTDCNVDIRLHRGKSLKSIGEFSFRVREEKRVDPVIHDLHKRDEPSFYSQGFMEALRNDGSKESQDALTAIETKPSVIARVGMWQINDEARGNLSTLRQLLRLALQECKKRNVSYVVGSYTPQSGEGLSTASYVEDMYKRIAVMTGGEVYSNGEVWVSIGGLEKWLSRDSEL